MTIDYFYNFEVDDSTFFYVKNKIITREEFIIEVDQRIKNLQKLKLDNQYIYININDPFNFYTSLFALWKLDKKVFFPTKDTLENNYIPTVAKYILNEKMEIDINEEYIPFEIDNGDTIVFSSGSTGVPKGIVHSNEHFFLNAYNTSNKINIKNTTSLTFLNPYLVSALSHFIVHWFSKSILIFEEFSKISLLGQYTTLSHNLNIVGSPIHIISSIKYLKKYEIIPSFFFSSGDMFHDSVIKKILKDFQGTTFLKVYGLAEIAGRLYINIITENKHVNSIGSPIDSVDVEFRDNEVVFKSPMQLHGYVINNKFYKHQDYFFTNDIIKQVDTQFVLQGRKNDEIKIAGNKVLVKYLENKIVTSLEYNHCTLIFLVAIPHQLFGHILALIVDENCSVTKESIISSLKNNLKTYEIPHKFYFIPQRKIPYTQSMKIDRNKLAQLITDNKLQQIT